MQKTKANLTNKSFAVFSLLLLTAFVSGCGNQFSSLEQVLATDAKKEALLGVRLERFNRYVYWGGLQSAAVFVSDEYRREFFRDFKNRRNTEKIVDLEVDSVDFINDGNTAEVVIKTRYFNDKGNHYVRSRQERQIWQFHRMSDGWVFHGTEPMEQEVASESGAEAFQSRSRAMLEQSRQR